MSIRTRITEEKCPFTLESWGHCREWKIVSGYRICPFTLESCHFDEVTASYPDMDDKMAASGVKITRPSMKEERLLISHCCDGAL